MQMILGDDYKRVRGFLETEKMGEESARMVLGGSPTQPRLAAERRQGAQSSELDDLLKRMVFGNTAGKGASVLKYGMGAVRRAIGPSDETNQELAKLLTTEGGGNIMGVLKRLGVRIPQAVDPVQREALTRALLTAASLASGARPSDQSTNCAPQ